MSRVVSSNFNALLDRFEEPGRDIAHLLSQMKEQIHLAQREVIRAMGEKNRLDVKLQEMAQQCARWEERAELAVRHGDDALARAALEQKQRQVAERHALERARDEQHGLALSMKQELERMQAKHQELMARQHTIAAQVAQARAGGGVESLGARSAAQGPFEALRQIEQRIDGAESEAQAAREVDVLLSGTAGSSMTKEELEVRFAELEKANPPAAGEAIEGVLDAELAALKKRIRVDG